MIGRFDFAQFKPGADAFAMGSDELYEKDVLELIEQPLSWVGWDIYLAGNLVYNQKPLLQVSKGLLHISGKSIRCLSIRNYMAPEKLVTSPYKSAVSVIEGLSGERHFLASIAVYPTVDTESVYFKARRELGPNGGVNYTLLLSRLNTAFQPYFE